MTNEEKIRVNNEYLEYLNETNQKDNFGTAILFITGKIAGQKLAETIQKNPERYKRIKKISK